MKHILNMTPEDLAAEVGALGQPAYRARQIAQWVWQRGECDFAEMTDLSKNLRAELPGRLAVLTGHVAARAEASDGTVKLLIEWPDGQRVETVPIPGPGRATACVSTQVGCPVGCAFCASGAGGLVRNLTAGEIVEQVFHLNRNRPADQPVSHVVFMGMGEPLANYEATVAAVHAIIDPERLGISARRVTVSTVGLPERIGRLAGEDLPITLALSLHAADNRLRRRLIPGAAPLGEVVEAAEEFRRSRNRRLTVEYVLLPGVNDGPAAAADLAAVARRLGANVNVIRYNPVPGGPFDRPSQRQTDRFITELEKAGANVQLRASRGLEADAACGQLRRRMEG
jgi:23S rRNA (adenine2503-C2)-methyltransferase